MWHIVSLYIYTPTCIYYKLIHIAANFNTLIIWKQPLSYHQRHGFCSMCLLQTMYPTKIAKPLYHMWPVRYVVVLFVHCNTRFCGLYCPLWTYQMWFLYHTTGNFPAYQFNMAKIMINSKSVAFISRYKSAMFLGLCCFHGHCIVVILCIFMEN